MRKSGLGRTSGPGQHSALRLSACVAALAMAGCATATDTESGVAQAEPQWAANGWLTPGPSGDPEIIGLFAEREECEAAVADWLARQVVGNPIHGECLPIDKR